MGSRVSVSISSLLRRNRVKEEESDLGHCLSSGSDSYGGYLRLDESTLAGRGWLLF